MDFTGIDLEKDEKFAMLLNIFENELETVLLDALNTSSWNVDTAISILLNKPNKKRRNIKDYLLKIPKNIDSFESIHLGKKLKSEFSLKN